MSNTKTEAQRLAEFKDLEYWPAGVGLTDWVESVCAEMLRLDAALADELNNRDVLDKMLTQCITERDQLRAQVERLQGGEPVNRPQNCGTSFCSCIECVCEPESVTLTDAVKALDDLQSAFMSHTQWNGTPPSEVIAARAIIAALREKEGK